MSTYFSKGRRGLLAPWAVAGVSAVAALGAIGCGGDNTPETTLSPGGGATETQVAKALTKAQFIEEADARCSETNASIQEYVDRGEGFSGAGEIADLREQLLVQLKDLGPPTEDRTTLDAYLTALENQVEAGQSIGLALDRGEDTAQFEAELETARGEAETAAAEYGFEECGTNKTTGTTTTATDTGVDSSGGAVIPSTGGSSSGGSSGGGSSGGGGGGVTPP